MEQLHKLETTIAEWYKGVPHLPKNAQKWIADNSWWVVLIVVILSVMGIFAGFAAMTALTALSGAAYGAYGAYGGMYGSSMMHANLGMALAAAWVSIIAMALTAVILGMAISPLKAHKKKGWDLLFLSDLLYAVISIIGAVLSYNFIGIFWPIVGLAIGLYFLFEIRSSFVGVGAKPVKTEEPKKAEKTDEKK